MDTYINRVGAELLQALLHALNDLGLDMVAILARVLDLGSQLQTTLLPLGFARKGLLLACNVDASRVDLVVAAGLESVEHGVVDGEVGNASAVLFRGTKGHETQDHSRLSGRGRNERHVDVLCRVSRL